MDRDILHLNVTPGSDEPLVCTHKSIRDAELREVAEARHTTDILLELLMYALGGTRD